MVKFELDVQYRSLVWWVTRDVWGVERREKTFSDLCFYLWNTGHFEQVFKQNYLCFKGEMTQTLNKTYRHISTYTLLTCKRSWGWEVWDHWCVSVELAVLRCIFLGTTGPAVDSVMSPAQQQYCWIDLVSSLSDSCSLSYFKWNNHKGIRQEYFFQPQCDVTTVCISQSSLSCNFGENSQSHCLDLDLAVTRVRVLYVVLKMWPELTSESTEADVTWNMQSLYIVNWLCNFTVEA